MAEIKIKEASLPLRCEVCHQADQFDAVTSVCLRCKDTLSEINNLKKSPDLSQVTDKTAKTKINTFNPDFNPNFSNYRAIIIWGGLLVQGWLAIWSLYDDLFRSELIYNLCYQQNIFIKEHLYSFLNFTTELFIIVLPVAVLLKIGMAKGWIAKPFTPRIRTTIAGLSYGMALMSLIAQKLYRIPQFKPGEKDIEFYFTERIIYLLIGGVIGLIGGLFFEKLIDLLFQTMKKYYLKSEK